jgi:hypothetical protein
MYKKIFTSFLVLVLMLVSLAPVSAELGLPVFEDIPKKGARFYIKDNLHVAGDNSPQELVDIIVDLPIQDQVSEYKFGKTKIYVDGKAHENGKYSYNTFGVEVEDKDEVKEYAIIYFDKRVGAYNVIYFVKETVEAQSSYVTSTSTKTVDHANMSKSLDDILGEALSKGNTAKIPWIEKIENKSYLTTGISVDATRVNKGEINHIDNYMSEIYVYLKDGGGLTYYYAFGVEKSTAAAPNKKVDAPRHLMGRAWGSRGIVTFMPPEDSEGVMGYQIRINSDQPEKFTKQTVVFLGQLDGQLNIDDRYEVEVRAVNMLGEESPVTTLKFKVEDSAISRYLSDIENNLYFKNYITNGYKMVYWDGYSDGTFRSETPISRQALAAFVYKSFRGHIPYNTLVDGQNKFIDVDSATNQFYPFIQSLKNAKIVRGFGDGSEFRPEENVDRASAVTFIFNALNYVEKDSIKRTSGDCFSDTGGSIHGGNICAFKKYGDGAYIPLAAGYSSGAFGVDDPLNRDAMATFLFKALAIVDIDTDTTGSQTIIEIRPSEGKGVVADTSGVYASGQSATSTYHLASAGGNMKFDFIRPLVPPIAVQGLSKYAVANNAAGLEWKNMITVDDSIDGYIIERSVADANSWRPLQGVYYTHNTENKAVLEITVAGTASENGKMRIRINNNLYTFDVETDQTAESIASEIATALNRAEGILANVVEGTLDMVEITSQIDGAEISFELPATEYDVSFTADPAVSPVLAPTSTAEVEILEGYIPASDFYPQSYVKVTDTNVSDNRSYDYRVRATKWIPFRFSEGRYTTQKDMVADTEIKVRDIEENSVYSEDSLLTVVIPPRERTY